MSGVAHPWCRERMNLLQQIRSLAVQNEVWISAHGYDELANDGLQVRDVLSGLADCELLREYPDYGKGPCVLVLFRLADGEPVHVVWGIPKGKLSPAVLVTAYRPDPAVWAEDFKTRRKP